MNIKHLLLATTTTMLCFFSPPSQACKCGDATYSPYTEACCKVASGNFTKDNDCDSSTLQHRSLFASCCWQGYRLVSDCSCSPGCIGEFEINPKRLARGLETLSQDEIRHILETYV
ncbi:hypothetical protein QBC37DRAFT_394121 [Rhypophila decipiens]|uniref:Uncharacterized protein n=1 Tax=Rhypophila decipiens TaxID=261697 RepID=A0AAN7BG62_9PEZI|nr:hypothetical protein QBC37DRAFT_394121 [Rhypophila decipiens]